MNLNQSEKEKYNQAWKNGAENNSRTAYPMSKYLSSLNREDKILDIGCGNGLTLNQLRSQGFNVRGMDITLTGLELLHPVNKFTNQIEKYQNDMALFTECPIWSTPFNNNEFDVTYSTDVLEHVPEEKLSDTILEIYRITKTKTIHIIATFPDKRHGFNFHLSVKPIEEWVSLFQKLNAKNLELEIWDRTHFLRKIDNDYKGI